MSPVVPVACLARLVHNRTMCLLACPGSRRRRKEVHMGEGDGPEGHARLMGRL